MDRFTIFSLLLLLPLSFFSLSEGGTIGVNYGRIANDLPSASKVVNLLKSNGIDRIKVYDSDPAVLRALANSNIKVTIDLPNEQLRSAATRTSYASVWVLRNVVAYYPRTLIEGIAVGNEVFVDPQNTTTYLVPAMKNIHLALVKYGLDSKIKVSSPIALSALGNSYPSSSGSFRPELVDPVFKPMLEFLRKTGSALMVNAYPIFAYQGNSDVISLDYALFRENPGVVDAGNGFRYLNLFDAQIDAVFAAMSALKYDDIPIVVTETGWPSKGDPMEIGASVENAAAYNGNLVRRILTGGGTPLRPKAELTVFLFALFNENKKPGPTSERNYGLFYPTQKKVYDIPLTVEEVKSWKDVKGSSPAPEVVTPAVSPATGNGGGAGKVTVKETWCVANGEMSESKLQAALDYACGEGQADCHPIQPGSPCFDPNTLEAHASYAFNSFYQKNGRKFGSCDFEGAAFVVSKPPRYGKCDFPTGY
ncbi:glucan endo-1,3-beta-glucosidase 12-like [Chenopodium quinoa]|uniref:glucan endo-1,3-beta-glucosidase 12-like n=1 Tax=Chenopodium quinoa TaxID=63459 RepID=UPI000B792EE2|nr:glucan endo-1,3-beta-glucosidase 12-like [Chenopodium quinoa]